MVFCLGVFAYRQDSEDTSDPTTPWSGATLNPKHQDQEALGGIKRCVPYQFLIGIKRISWTTRKLDHLKQSKKSIQSKTKKYKPKNGINQPYSLKYMSPMCQNAVMGGGSNQGDQGADRPVQ